ncbi:UNVERIFIED_CONTAM: hypothetical protein GTU68_023575 [Idotea baltica]|nr:hypothetical protein [Idotea baltica]
MLKQGNMSSKCISMPRKKMLQRL